MSETEMLADFLTWAVRERVRGHERILEALDANPDDAPDLVAAGLAEVEQEMRLRSDDDRAEEARWFIERWQESFSWRSIQ